MPDSRLRVTAGFFFVCVCVGDGDLANACPCRHLATGVSKRHQMANKGQKHEEEWGERNGNSIYRNGDRMQDEETSVPAIRLLLR